MSSSRGDLLLRASAILALVALTISAPAYAATYSMTLHTNLSSYSGAQPIVITGTISPAPGPSAGVVITITDQAGSTADADEVSVLDNGSFKWTSFPGGNADWTSGTFTVNATWGGAGGTASQVATFTYSPTASTTLTTTSSTSSTTISSSTTSSVTGGGTTTSSTAPEFPSGALPLVALVAVALVALLSRRSSLLSSRRDRHDGAERVSAYLRLAEKTD